MYQRRPSATWLTATGWLALTGLVLSTATAASAHKPHDDQAKGGRSSAPQHAAGGHPHGGASHGGAHGAAPAQPGATATTGMVFLAADLNGADEVPVAGGPASGDRDGEGRAIVRVFRDQVCFTTTYAKIGAPTAGHVHAGAAGANGGVKVAFFAAALPPTLSTVTGCVTQDPATVEGIVAHPEAHYVNLHTAEFPGGAVRGQLHRLDKPVDLLEPLRNASLAVMDGTQEVPEPGDPDGHATGFVRARQHQLDFAFSWAGIAPPTAGHLHPGLPGEANPLAVEVFASPHGLPPSVRGVAGTADASEDVLTRVGNEPRRFYLNLHNAEFAKGAVRGQLSRR